MYIYGLLDFFENKEKIKRKYKKMSMYEKYLYKMYIYSLCFECRDTKDLIWEYINDYKESSPDLFREYRIRKSKNERRKKYENKD